MEITAKNAVFPGRWRGFEWVLLACPTPEFGEFRCVNAATRAQPAAAGPLQKMKTIVLQSGQIGVEVGDGLDAAEIVF